MISYGMKKLLIVALVLEMGVSVSAVSAHALIDLTLLDPAQASEQIFAESTTSSEDLVLNFVERGHLLALVPLSLKLRVTVSPDGSVKVEYPWYSKFTLDHEEEMKTNIKVAVDNTLHNATVGSVVGAGKSTQPEFSNKVRETLTKNIQRAVQSVDKTGE